MQNIQINSDQDITSTNDNVENVCDNEVNNNNINSDNNYKCNTSNETTEEQHKNTQEESNDSKEENQNSQNPTKYVPVRYSYSGGYFDKQFAEIEVQMNLAEVKNSLAKTCEILKEINFLESLRKGAKLSETKLESSQEFDLEEVTEISESEHTTS